MEFEGRKKIALDLNIAPLIDVVFLLLIFFMLTSSLMRQEGIDLSLPGASSAQSLENSSLVVSIDKEGQLYLNGASVRASDLKSMLEIKLSSDSSLPITLQSDSRINVSQFVSVLDLIKAAGGTDISILTQPHDP